MSLKRLKKPPSKRKPNEKKGTKSQVSKMKLKSEVEVAAKELLSELDKEILVVHITESEGKLNRKMHLCSHIEEEVSICRTLYCGKLFLKSESMKLLNKAFQDFDSEIFLLDEECKAMESLFTQRQHFCTEYQKRVDMLNALGAELEMKLLESEKCFHELPVFMKILTALKETAYMKKKIYKSQKEQVQENFDACLLRIQNEVCVMKDEVIHEKDLKLFLLPFPWQALFRSGWLSKSWLEASIKHLEYQKNQNTNLEWNKLREDDLDVTFSQETHILSCEKKAMTSEEAILDSGHSHQYLYLQTEILHQQNKVESMKSEIVDLENVIHSLEISGESYFDKSYLLQIVHNAGSLLKQEFETQ